MRAKAADLTLVNLLVLLMRFRIAFYGLRRLLKQHQEPSFVIRNALGRVVPMVRQVDSLPIRGGQRSRPLYITIYWRQGHLVVWTVQLRPFIQ